MKIFLLTISFFFGISLASQEIPIPSRLDGIKIGKTNSTFHLEAHLDLLCPGSKDSFFTLMQIINDHQLYNENFLFTVHIFPLPYHTFSFKLSILEKFIHDIYGETMALNYIRFIFENQEQYSNFNLSNLTIHQIDNKISEDVSKSFNQTIKKFELLNALQNSTYNEEARISWKFGCLRSVAGTPTHFVNGIRLNDSWELEYNDWVEFLKKYIPMTKNIIITLRNPKLK